MSFVDEKVQTLAYFGMDKNDLKEKVMENNLRGIDRIVPFGNTLDIGILWDGYDIICQLSRIIEVL